MRSSLPPLAAVCAALALLAAGCGEGSTADDAPPQTAPPQAAPPATSPVETEPPATAPEPLPPPTRPMSWQSAGAFVWHETDVDPRLLASLLVANGFGWVAVRVHDGPVEDPVEADWVRRFRIASGLPVGGWGVLRSAPRREAELAAELVRRHGLDFYVANAEAEYEYSGPDGPNGSRYRRSDRFVRVFRALQPDLLTALSSYCRADMHDIDWKAWQAGGFAFLPQAYVNDFGGLVDPAACTRGARGFFPAEAVHPTIGMHPGQRASLSAAAYVPLLERAGTVGFSVYLAETRMPSEEWAVLGEAIARQGVAS